MNKGDLIDIVALKAQLTKAEAGRALDAVFDAITDDLAKGGKVSVPGFGTFSTSTRSARTGRNPATGATISIAAKTTAKFKPGTKLTEAVN